MIEEQIICSFNVEKRSISECLCSLLAPLVLIFFSCVKIFDSIDYFKGG